jgi:ABC-type antimicrobial peptide transport system permease subunit
VRYVDAIISAFDSLRANPVRGALTLLGIVIGVAAVILVVAIGSGASEVVMQEIRSLGSNLLVVASGPAFVAPGAPSLSVSVPDAVAIKQNIDEVDLAVPVVQRDVQVVRGDLNLLTHLFGVSPGFLAARDWVVGSGRDFTPDEARIGSKVALIGQTVANTLFGAADPVGAVVRINQVPLTVIGVLAPKGPTTSGRDQDDLVITPLITMRAHLFVMGRATNWIVDSILVKVADEDAIDGVEQDVRALLQERHHLNDSAASALSIENLAEISKTKAASARALATLVAAVASVSLVVGGIGIMNIMLVSVVERTREIGVRMAVGARRRDVLAQFLVESIVIAAVGGLVGLIIGIVAAGIIADLAGWPWIISPTAVTLAIGCSVSVGVLFGFYPAQRAAMLDPIEALRRE